jgi:hypothetical protein
MQSNLLNTEVDETTVNAFEGINRNQLKPKLIAIISSNIANASIYFKQVL